MPASAHGRSPERERRARMGAYGRKRVEDVLAWDHEVPRLLAAYDALFKAR